ncbi:MAG TPA: ribosome maturation factor RimM, partial [Candidatus Kapabacteria bacterium]|nr:ribosome maturation factor RimM [Candidatus Kapabacteria bacterium]
MRDDLILIARFRKPHGLKGEIGIELFTWDDRRFEHLHTILIKSKDGQITEQEVQAVRYIHKGILLKIKGFDDLTAVESLRGAEIFIPESERPKLPEGRAYYDEVIGMAVVD